MVFDGNDGSIRERRGHRHLRDLAIERKKKTAKETLPKKLEGGMLAAVLTINREMALISIDQTEGGLR